MKLVTFVGATASLSAFLVLFITFMLVYFGYWDGIDINKYGEANIEFVLLVTLLPFVVYSFLQSIKTISR